MHIYIYILLYTKKIRSDYSFPSTAQLLCIREGKNLLPNHTTKKVAPPSCCPLSPSFSLFFL